MTFDDSITISIQSDDPAILFTALLADGSPTLSGGSGVWTEDERPKRKSFTQFKGVTPYQLSIGVVLEGFATGESVEPDVDKLTSFTHIADGYSQPPVCTVDGIALPPLALDLEWVVGSVEWGPAQRNEEGDRIRQVAQIMLIEFVEPELLVVAQPVIGIVPNYKLYRVRPGDTLPKIATRLYKKSSRWREIARMNKLRGPGIPRRLVGKRIKVPRR